MFNIRYSTCYCTVTDQLSMLSPRRESTSTGLETKRKGHLCSCCVFQTCSIFWLLVLSEAFVYISNRFLLARRALLMSAESQRIFRNYACWKCIKKADELHFGEAMRCVLTTRSWCDLNWCGDVPQPAGGTGVNAASLCLSHALTHTCFSHMPIS